MKRAKMRLILFLLVLAVALPAAGDSRYEKLTTKYRLSQCSDRVKAIRDRMLPATRAIFSRCRST